MGKEYLDTSGLDNCRISIIRGGGCPCESQATRAVIELSGDISPAMPHLHRAIDTCGYNPEAKVIAFRAMNLGVVVEANKIIVNDADNVTKAQEILDWLKDMIKSAA